MTSPLKVNFTQDEATSKPREVLPTGEYVCSIVEASDEVVRPGKKNHGKPYWKVRFVVQAGPFEGQNIYATVMLFDGALYSLAQLMSALGQDINSGEFIVPETEWLIGKPVTVRGQRKSAETKDGQDLPERFEVKGYKAIDSSKKAVSSSLLP